MHELKQRTLRFVSSRAFFYGTIMLFVFQSAWLALSADFPMPFDEEFHVGVIKIYAQQWSPFLAVQPPGSETFGSLLSDPSYFFHYLMSFPYRLIAAITDSLPAQVICLRFINIALFTLALVVFRNVMVRSISSRLTHVSLALMTLIPVVPYLAAQVNYDNGLMLVVVLLLSLAVNILAALQKRQLDMRTIVCFVAVAALGCLVKYTLLPILAGTVLFLLVYIYRIWHGHWQEVIHVATADWQHMGRWLRLGLCGLLLISCSLFIQKYGTNLVRYHALIPKCHQVLTEQQCMSFGPWGRNNRLAASKGYVDPNPFAYGITWVRGLTQRLFFTLGGPDVRYATRRPLPLPIVAASLTVAGGLVCLVWRFRILRDPYLGLFATVVCVYCSALFLLDNYPQYLQTGQPVAINGRYLIPLLPLMLVLLGRAYGAVFVDRTRLKTALVLVVILCFLQGGGVMTYIVRSDVSWYWNNQTAIRVNQYAQKLLKPLLIERGIHDL